MYWLQRPPYVRRAVAVLIVATALLWDLRSAPVESRPFATRAIEQGEPVADAVEWREVAAGLWPRPDLAGSVAAIPLEAGDPITTSVLTGPVFPPDDWWSLPITIGVHAEAGDTVMLLITEPPVTVPGLVVSPQNGDPYSLDFEPAVVAVPGESAALVAVAAQQDRLAAAVKP